MIDTYYEQHNRKKYKELTAKLKELPAFCIDFFVGIEHKTSVLTRLGYALDLVVFFDYLINNNVNLKGLKATEITLENLDTLKAVDIERFLNYLTYYTYKGKEYKNTNSAKARKLSSVRSFFKYYYNNSLLKENVASKVSPPKLYQKNIVRLENSEVERLLDNVESEKKFGSQHQDSYNLHTRDRDIAIITLLLGTGIRVSECVGLNIDDIDLDNMSFIVTRKGGNRSILYFSDEVRDALFIYLPERLNGLKKRNITNENALFLSLQQKRISVRAVENLVKKHSKTAAPLKNISPHKLRSTYGTALYRSTKDIYVVAEILGHKDVNTTKKHYAALSEDIKKDARDKVKLRKDD